jgi:hypothetical protein
MIAVFVVVAAFLSTACGAGLPELVPIPGPSCKIPCKVREPNEVERVQLYVSEDRGKTWAKYAQGPANVVEFTFCAPKAGEYWFTARVRKKDGTLDPADPADFKPMQRVMVTTGAGGAARAPDAPQPLSIKLLTLPAARELDTELSRLEMEFIRVEAEWIRKELKRLGAEEELTDAGRERLGKLRKRLVELRDALRAAQADAPRPVALPAVPKADDRTPVTEPAPGLPAVPTLPARPVAPPPHAPAPR